MLLSMQTGLFASSIKTALFYDFQNFVFAFLINFTRFYALRIGFNQVFSHAKRDTTIVNYSLLIVNCTKCLVLHLNHAVLQTALFYDFQNFVFAFLINFTRFYAQRISR